MIRKRSILPCAERRQQKWTKKYPPSGGLSLLVREADLASDLCPEFLSRPVSTVLTIDKYAIVHVVEQATRIVPLVEDIMSAVGADMVVVDAPSTAWTPLPVVVWVVVDSHRASFVNVPIVYQTLATMSSPCQRSVGCDIYPYLCKEKLYIYILTVPHSSRCVNYLLFAAICVVSKEKLIYS